MTLTLVIPNKDRMTKAIAFLYSLLVIFLIYTSNKSMLYSTLLSKELSYWLLFGVAFVLLCASVLKGRMGINGKILGLSIVISIIYCLSSFAFDSFYINNFTFVFYVLIVATICVSINQRSFIRSIPNAVVFLAICSLIGTYIVQPIYMKGALPFISAFQSIEGYPFLNLGVSFPLAWDGVQRNFGIFNEPGTYQFFLLLAYCIEKYYIKSETKVSFLKRAILVLTVLSTFSTAGIAVMLILLAFGLIRGFRDNPDKALKKAMFWCIPILIVFLVVLGNDRLLLLFSRSFDKIKSASDNSSFFVRFFTPFQALAISLESPVIGMSFNAVYERVYSVYYSGEMAHLTGTFFIFAAGLGYPIGALFIFLFNRLCKIIACDNRAVSVVVFLSLFLSCMSQNFVSLSFFILLLFLPLLKTDCKIGKVIDRE